MLIRADRFYRISTRPVEVPVEVTVVPLMGTGPSLDRLGDVRRDARVGGWVALVVAARRLLTFLAQRGDRERRQQLSVDVGT